MDTINFINPVPPSKDKEVRRWLFLTFLTIASIILFILIIGGMKAVMFYQLLRERKEQQSQQNKVSIQQQQQTEKQRIITKQQKKHDKLKQYRSHPKNVGQLLVKIGPIVGPSNLQSCNITQHTFEIGCSTTSADQAQQLVHKLAQLEEVSNVTLQSLRKEQQQFKALIRGEYPSSHKFLSPKAQSK